jgi:ABC-type Fe3+ transport system permease subunit
LAYLSGTGAAFVRACAIAFAATGLGLGVDALLRSRRLGPRARTLAWALLLAPFLTPSILVGYGWRMTALALRGGAAAQEILYAFLVLAKLAPAAAVVLHFAPRAISLEARHCHALALAGVGGRARRFMLRAGLWLRGDGAAAGAAGAVVFLLAFAEFEIASLLNVRSTWTVSLFEAHVGGLALGRSLALGVVPFAVELAALGAVGVLLFRAARSRADADRSRVAPAPALGAAMWGWLAAAATVATVIPAWVAAANATGDPGAVFRSASYAREIAASVVLGLAGGGLAYFAGGRVAAKLVRVRRESARLSSAICIAVAAAAPGLLGGLVLALAVLALFQLPGLRAIYDTPAPLLIAVTLLVLPFAVLLRMFVDARRPGEALHLAGMLACSGARGARRNAGGIAWALIGRRRAWVAFLLFAWAYFDMTASSILAPSGATPVFVTLYNFMHYGRKAATSAMVAGAFAAPVMVLLAGGIAARVASRATARS